MAYYISTNKADLEAYNEQVKVGEGYDGVYTTDWATPIAHPNGVDFAIVKHPNYEAELTIEKSLGSDWYPEEFNG